MIHRLLANVAVTDSAAAREWYTRLLEREPDSAPMGGLLEWHLSPEFGLQTWVDAERAGTSVVVLGESDLDAAAARLSDLGMDHSGTQPGGGSRILVLSDPDGNRVVLTGE